MTLTEIWHGDSVELSKKLEAESVDLIFTDPIYEKVDDYSNLAYMAYRLLKWDKPMLVWCSKKKEFLLKELFESYGFTWVWTLNYVVVAKASRLIGHHLITWNTPCLWFNKGQFAPDPWLPDTFISDSKPQGKHKWNKNLEVHLRWMWSFSRKDDLVFDPFCGSGPVVLAAKKLGRAYLGIETEQKTYQYVKTRLSQIEIQAFPYQYQPDSLF